MIDDQRVAPVPHGKRPGASPLRLLFVQPQAENAGAQAIARSLAGALSTRGYSADQAFFYRKTGAFDGENGVTYCSHDKPATPLAFLRFFVGLVRTIRRQKPDVVLCFQHYGNIVGACAARLAGVPVVVANQNSARDTTPPVARWVDQVLGALGLYRRIVVNSHDSARDLNGYPRWYLNRVVHIDHGFAGKESTLTPAEARATFALPAGPLLGCVARLHPLKDLGAAVRLLSRDPTWHLALAGQGPDESRITALANSLGCAHRLHLVGEMSPERVGDFLRAIDVFVFPSKAETFGLAAVEAAQAGVPVIANALPVLREVLATPAGPSALFVDTADTEAFAAAVRQVISEPGLADRLRHSATALGDRFPLEAMVDSYDELIRDLTSQSRAASPEAL